VKGTPAIFIEHYRIYVYTIMSIRDIMKCLKCNLPIYTTGCGPGTCTIEDRYIKSTLQEAMMQGFMRRFVWLKELSPGSRSFFPYNDQEVVLQQNVFFKEIQDDGWEPSLNETTLKDDWINFKTTDAINAESKSKGETILHTDMKQILYTLGRTKCYICTFRQEVKLSSGKIVPCSHIAISPYSWDDPRDIANFHFMMRLATQNLLQANYYDITLQPFNSWAEYYKITRPSKK
jgi:hypothetical protein